MFTKTVIVREYFNLAKTVFKNIKLFEKHQNPALGRWNLTYDKRVNNKVDLANEDHCGPCGEYYKQKK